MVTNDGTRHEVDMLILGTGFAAYGLPRPDGDSWTWRSRLSAAGATAPRPTSASPCRGFPNLFMLYGPNTNLGHNSIVYMLESQIQYVKDAVPICTLRREPHST